MPGITAGVAAPAYAGIPVTHRELASGVAFVTGHEDPDKPESALDWAALARFPGTLVFYMGVRALPRIAERLQAEGRLADEPVAVIERGTLPGPAHAPRHARRRRRARAGEGHPRARRSRSSARSPALREDLAWLERRPLHGRTVAVTRARAQASPLAARLRELGADVIEAPAIRTRSLARRGARPERLRPARRDEPERRARAVRAALRDAREPRRPARRGDGPRDRARAARSTGSRPTSCPSRSVAEGMVEALADVPVERVLDRARQGGPRRAARGAARSAAPRSTSSRSTRPSPEPLDAEAIAGGRRAPTTSRSPPPRPSATCSRRRARTSSTSPGSPRSDPPPAPSCAPTAASPTSRPTPTPPTDWWTRYSPTREARRMPRPITFLSDYGLADEFVGVVHAVIAHECPDRPGHRPLARRPAPVRARRRADARARPPLRAARRAPRGRRPRGRRAAARRRAAHRARRPPARRPRQRAAAARRRPLRVGRRGGRDLDLAVAAGAGVAPPSTAATCSRPSPPGSPPGEALADAGTPLDPDELVRLELPTPRKGRKKGQLIAHAMVVDGFGNVQLDARAARPRDRAPRPPRRRRRPGRRRPLPAHVRRRRAGRAAALRGRGGDAGARGQRRRGGRESWAASRPATRSACTRRDRARPPAAAPPRDRLDQPPRPRARRPPARPTARS